MSVAESDLFAQSEAPKLRTFLLTSVGLHMLLLVYYLLGGGIFGTDGDGGGDALMFQLAAGENRDDDAAANIDGTDLQTATYADADIDPVPEPAPEPEPEPVKPEPKPEPKPEVTDQLPTRRNEDVKPQAATTPQRGEAEVTNPGGSVGTTGDDPYAAGGNLEETIRNRPGNALSGNAISARMTGHTLHLEMGRLDIQGGNRLTNTTIRLNADGTSDVELVYYHYKTFHQERSSTRRRSSSGRWWIEGNRFCHQAAVIDYNTKNCYDMNLDGSVLRLYYSQCLRQSSPHCKSYRLAGEGSIQ
jgi:ribosomal protein S6E (S10)